jgi:hypothetical protein
MIIVLRFWSCFLETTTTTKPMERAGCRDAGGGREDYYTLKNILTVLIQATIFYNQERSQTGSLTETSLVCRRKNEWTYLFETKFLKETKWLQIVDSIVLLSQSPVFSSSSILKDLEILLSSFRQILMKNSS